MGINDVRQNEQDGVLVTFSCGWGRKVRLYREYLDIDNSIYALADLLHVRPIYQHMIGVASARLVLRFRAGDVVLRGIADIDALRKVVVYLSTWCSVGMNARQQACASEPLKPRLQDESLPGVPVPLQLQPGERAHYVCEATLCKEQSSGRIADRGTLILTNRRAIYLGRISQRVIDYAHLTHTSWVQRALILARGDRSQRDIFEVERPSECMLYLETMLRSWHALPPATERVLTPAPAPQEIVHHTPLTPSTTSHLHWTYASIPVPVPQQRRKALKIDEIETMPLSVSASLWQMEEQV